MAVNWTLALKIILWLWYWFNSIYVSFSLHKSSISILMRPKQCRPILLLTSLFVSRQAPLPPRGPGHRGRVRGGRGRGGQQPRPLRHRGRAARHHLPLGAQHQHRPHHPRAAQVRYFLLIWYFLTKLIFYRFHLRAGLRRCHWPSTRSGMTPHPRMWRTPPYPPPSSGSPTPGRSWARRSAGPPTPWARPRRPACSNLWLQVKHW